MAQPVPFHNPNTPYNPQQNQRVQTPGTFNYPKTSQQATNNQFTTHQHNQQQFYSDCNEARGQFYSSISTDSHQSPTVNQGFQQRHPYHPTPHQSAGQLQNDFINEFSQNPMAGLAVNTATDFIQKQSQLYMPGAYGIWGSLKYYFTVNNSYVKSRLKILLFPFWHKDWRRIGSNEQEGNKMTQYAPPTSDVNAPDLYIPLMGFITYILLVGYGKGATEEFSPDVIGEAGSYCLVLQLIEIGVMTACLYLLNSSISILDLLSFSGYKYACLVINAVIYQLTGKFGYYVSILYTGLAVSYFTLNCLKGSVAEPSVETRAFRNYMLFGVSCLQIIIVWWNSSKWL